jgi:hypothetical protein
MLPGKSPLERAQVIQEKIWFPQIQTINTGETDKRKFLKEKS